MKIHIDCFIDLLAQNNIEPEYINNLTPGITIYHFPKPSDPQLSFDSSCIPIVVAQHHLGLFGLGNLADQLKLPDCYCDW